MIQTADQMGTEREPVLEPVPEHVGRQSEHPARPRPATGGQIDPVLVPGPESPGPSAGRVHPGDDGVLATDMADEVDRTVDKKPPELGWFTFVEQGFARLDRDGGPSIGQQSELIMAESTEDRERAEIVGDQPVLIGHQIVAR